jgi:hypothetical protein
MYYTYGHYKADSKELFYIGKGKNNRAQEKDSRSDWWQNIVNKHGFSTEIFAEWPTEKEAFEHEKFLIECFKDLTVLCNLTNGGEGCSGYVWTKEQKDKLKNRLPHNTGKVWNESVRQKISLAQKGKKRPSHSPEHCRKIGLAHKNKSKSAEQLEKMRINGILQGKVLRICPHCGHENYGVNIFRWHFDNCKEKLWN